MKIQNVFFIVFLLLNSSYLSLKVSPAPSKNVSVSCCCKVSGIFKGWSNDNTCSYGGRGCDQKTMLQGKTKCRDLSK